MLWAYRMAIKTHLLGVLAEIGMLTYRVLHFDPNHNNERLKENLDLLDERR